jgi:hypothetical protein
METRLSHSGLRGNRTGAIKEEKNQSGMGSSAMREAGLAAWRVPKVGSSME